MEDATITSDNNQDQMYQQGKYPSIVDTDDLVFELGKQVINNINHEKLISQLIEKAKLVEAELKSIRDNTVLDENKLKSIQESNKLYEQNNKDLADKIVNLNAEINTIRRDFALQESVYKETISRLESTERVIKKKKKPSTKNKVKEVKND